MMFDGMNDAPIFERGSYFPAGFSGEVRIERCVSKRSRKGDDAFIAECTVLTSNHADAPAGSRRSWYQSFKEREAAFGTIKEFLAAVAGIPISDMTTIKAQIFPRAAAIATAAVGPSNALVGLAVHLETWSKPTKNNGTFTVHSWGPSRIDAVDLGAQRAAVLRAGDAPPAAPAAYAPPAAAPAAPLPVLGGLPTAALPALPAGFAWGPGGAIVKLP